MLSMFLAQALEIPQYLFLFFAEIRWRLDMQLDNHIAFTMPTQTGHAFLAQGEDIAGLTPSRDIEILFAMDGRHFDSRSQGRLDHGYRQPTIDGVTLSFEEIMFLNMDYDIEIT